MKHSITNNMKLIYSIFLLFILLIIYNFDCSGQQIFINNGISVVSNPGITLYVRGGGITNQDSGTFNNSGSIELQGNWINNAGNTGFINSSPGNVILIGDTQKISGNSVTQFYDLILQGTGIKMLDTINAIVEDSLVLNDRELATDYNTLFVTSTDPGIITHSTGFVSSLDTGGLSRNTAATVPYLFPAGSSIGTPRYRPVEITPGSILPHTFKVRMANVDATAEGFDRINKDSTLCYVNPDFYHRITRNTGTDAADITIYFDNVIDSAYEAIVHWQNAPQWENTGQVTIVSNVSPVLSSITKSSWDDFSYTPFALGILSPVVTIVSSSSAICEGENLTFTATDGYSNYEFFVNSLSVQNGTDSIYVTDSLTTGDTTRVVVTDAGCFGYSNEIISSIINPIYSIPATASICSGDSIFLGGAYQNTICTYYDTLFTVDGCDSIIGTTLTINSTYSTPVAQTICDNDSVLLEGAWQNTSGIYFDTLPAVNGCDSVIITTLTIDPTYSTPVAQTICDNDSVLLEGAWQNTSGIYYDTLPTANVCDSIIIITLIVNPTYSTPVAQTICDNDSVLLEGGWQNTSGTYYDTLLAANGCDSIIVTTLSVNATYSTPEAQTICDNDSVLLEGVWQNTAGTYYDSLPAVNGCDSVIITTLTVDPTYSTPIAQTICDIDSILLEGAWQNTSGTYFDTLPASNGCDSVIITTLTVDPTYSTPIAQTICDIDSVLLEGAWQNTSGIYYDTLPAANGCDSVIITTLTVDPTYSIPEAQTICDNDSVFLEGAWQNTTGTYYDTLPTTNECDSVIVTTLSIDSAYSTTEAASICSGESIFMGGDYQSTAGTYYDTIATITGCDSVIATTLVINPLLIVNAAPDTISIIQGESVNLNVSGGVSYQWTPSQWLDNPNNSSPVATPSETIVYYSYVTDVNGCINYDSLIIMVSEDMEFFVPDIFSPNNDGYNDILYVMGKGINWIIFKIYDRWGKKVFESNDINIGWDGTFRGKPMDPAVFVYILEIGFINGENISESGNITFVR
ncbi:MAG: gliding motility-associated C-terminal domain-containing protein [Bacteroidota bacterium]